MFYAVRKVEIIVDLRKEIKHNFLKQIMFRMDFKGLLENDVENSVSEVRQFLYENGLVDLNTRTENQMDLQVKIDLNLPEENPFSVRNISTDTVYVFKSNDQNEIIEISRTFLTLTVTVDQVYSGFDKYVELLVKFIIALKTKSPFFKVMRIGLRKINLCYVDDLNTLSEYFVTGAFNISETLGCMKGLTGKASNLLTILEKEPFQINYVRNLQEGMIVINGDQVRVYQAIIDVDVYCDSIRDIEILLKNEDSVREMLIQQNTTAFVCYVNSLTESFIKKLTEKEFNDKHIWEVHE